MQLLEGYQDVDFAKQSLPYNKMSETTIPLGIETPGGKMVLNFMENTLPRISSCTKFSSKGFFSRPTPS